MGLPSYLKPYLLFLLLCLLNVITINSKKSLKGEAVLFGGNFPALYVIGDSLVDPGNNNHLLTLVKANFKPYGSNFEGGKATGRFSDGKTIADYGIIFFFFFFFFSHMGLSKKEKNNLSTGFNYASASCGIFPDTGKQFGRCLSMNVQIDLLNKTIKKNLKKKFKRQSELSRHLGGSLFMTAIGVNDYAFTYKKNATDANEFASKLLNEFLIRLERLYNLGARNFFVNNIKPLGCYPNIIAETVPRGSCDDSLNLAIDIFNVQLRESLSHMRHKLSNTSFLYSDYFNFMLELRGPSSNQVSSNLLNTTSPCCPKVYNGGSTTTCLPFSKACKEPDMFIFFDPRHPTQIANFMYAIRCFQERQVCHVVID
ncbi:PREDICTED: GDSL esterase/lipase At2g03980-like isoform X1 [Brassica oleracea var. oleracea]|uniref:GDSL esterase/lipase At2g03980-like isoform X1 n=1 Tax=Brassica oleracea var. oleracea TaxID=109376 RepID=UPI0006A6C711|nr:PREDICTED: GDSL esterase/lipase At2g03980-like isoform X1 [Brassica oleracea var. oleracea]